MLKKILLSIIILSTVVTLSSFADELNSKKFNSIFTSKEKLVMDKIICNSLEKYCVSIYSVNPGFTKCSGVVINKDQDHTYILTAKHCLNVKEEMYAENYRVDHIIASGDDDLAILVIEGNIKNKEITKLSLYKGFKNDKIYLIGYPSLTSVYQSVGKIVQYSRDWGWAHLKNEPGCSGGGIFNKQKELIGILWGGIATQEISVFENVSDIKRFLKAVKLL